MKNRYKDQQTQICQFYKWVKDHARLVDPNYNFCKWFALRLHGIKQKRITKKS